MTQLMGQIAGHGRNDALRLGKSLLKRAVLTGADSEVRQLRESWMSPQRSGQDISHCARSAAGAWRGRGLLQIQQYFHTE